MKTKATERLMHGGSYDHINLHNLCNQLKQTILLQWANNQSPNHITISGNMRLTFRRTSYLIACVNWWLSPHQVQVWLAGTWQLTESTQKVKKCSAVVLLPFCCSFPLKPYPLSPCHIRPVSSSASSRSVSVSFTIAKKTLVALLLTVQQALRLN